MLSWKLKIFMCLGKLLRSLGRTPSSLLEESKTLIGITKTHDDVAPLGLKMYSFYAPWLSVYISKDIYSRPI